jgi:anti-sigma factor RsiW
MLEAYLDKELDRRDARELEDHLDGCADCRAALTRLDELRLALRDRALRYEAPAALRARIAAATASGSATTASSSSASRLPSRRAWSSPASWQRLAAACVLAFGAGAGAVYLWTSRQPAAGEAALVAHDLFASHWRALAAASPVDVVSSDRHTVKPWFAGKVAQAPLVLDFADRGFALVGGRIDYVGAQRVPVLVYRHGQHLIDVFVLPQPAAATVAQPVQREGYSLNAISLGGQPAAIVSDMDAHELAAFGQLLSAAQ